MFRSVRKQGLVKSIHLITIIMVWMFLRHPSLYDELHTTSNHAQHNQYWYVSLFQSTILIWEIRYFINNQYNILIMNLLHTFHYNTCPIYWLLNLCLGIVPDNQYNILFYWCADWSFSNSNKLSPFLHDYYLPSEELSDKKKWYREKHHTFPMTYYHECT